MRGGVGSQHDWPLPGSASISAPTRPISTTVRCAWQPMAALVHRKLQNKKKTETACFINVYLDLLENRNESFPRSSGIAVVRDFTVGKGSKDALKVGVLGQVPSLRQEERQRDDETERERDGENQISVMNVGACKK